MKQKIFTLLLAIGVLTAFQANADRRVRIRADLSGLDKGGAPVTINEKDTTLWQNDSFPHTKKYLSSWLSVNSEGKVVVKSAPINSATDTLPRNINKHFYGDKSNVFNMGLSTSDSTNYSFAWGTGGLDRLNLALGTENRTNFEIVTLKPNLHEETEANRPNAYNDGETANLAKFLPGYTEGYLASVPAQPKGTDIKLDTIEYALVVAHKTTGELKLRSFNDFAIWDDSLLSAPFWKYEYGNAKPTSADGKLYWNDSFPHFQTLDQYGEVVIDTSRNEVINDEMINWADSIPNSKYSKIYTWLDLKLVGDSSIELTLTDTTFCISLDSIIQPDTARHGGWDILRQHQLKGRKLNPELIRPLRRSGSEVLLDTASHVYLQADNGRLSFTAKIDSTGDIGKDWTHGEPKIFYKNDFMYYYSIDTSFFGKLDTIIKRAHKWDSQKCGQDTTDARHPRYLYINDDDEWRPLYIKIDTVPEYPLSEYVGEKWVKENRYALGAALQTIVGTTPSAASTGEHAAVVGEGSANAAKFLFEFADTIRSESNGKGQGWFTKPYPYSKGQKFATLNDSIELFRIQYEGKYLTVLNETEFFDPNVNNTVANTQLGWSEGLNDNKERVRQYFAIVRNYVDSSVAFLPVASRKWKAEGGVAQYGTSNSDNDTLSFNLQIGRQLEESGIADLAGTWYISQMSKTGDATQKLVIADSSSTQPRIWFDLKPSLRKWEDGKNGYVAVKQVRSDKYYTAEEDKFLPDVTENDVTAHWKMDSVTSAGIGDAWRFTHVIESAPQSPTWLKDTVCIFADDEDQLFVTNTDLVPPILDTIEVNYIDASKFSLFNHWEKQYKGKDIPDITILSSTDNKGISVGPEIQDGIYKASYVTADEYPVVSVEKHKGKFYLDLKKEEYEIFYYQFSRTDDDGREYFLGVKNDKVNWTLSSTVSKEDSSAYWFAIPKVSGKDGCYLQSLDDRLIRLTGDGLELVYSPTVSEVTSLYEVIALYTKPEAMIISWKFEAVDPFKDAEWVSIDESLFEDGLANGVLTANYSGVGSTFIGSDEDGKGVLSNNKTDPRILLQLKMQNDDDNVPSPQSIIAYSQSKATAVSNERTYYHIMQDGRYLMDNGAVASFGEESQSFSFLKTGEADEFLFAIVSDKEGDAPRYLSSMGANLVFASDENTKLSFQWGKLSDYSGIKAITVLGKIYGVTGGVKVSGATGAVAIYTVDGRLVTKETVTSPNQTIAVPAGIYVVKSGAEVTKVVVK